ncbi:putative mitochondrial protein [Cucumis melo var. makuwa]|uniref:Mitochondrial protein n=1 Tax=Cucumis melo var. makuwa TaxID=1194695 RepID=A0A5A7UWL9_CUCMM|nr:putative mitochondrial protein [Cucumis melo var. makuwa]TYK21551.1 putative mitochondrial protein [Cucumis melo var. makuwa]
MHEIRSGEKDDESLYCSIIGSLLYLIVSRLDIAFSVGVFARYQANPMMSRLKCAKCISDYITGTLDFGLWYTFDTTSVLVGYCDANWAGCVEDHKSTSGGCFFLESTKVLHAQSTTTLASRHLKKPSKCNTATVFQVSPSASSRPATQRKPRVIISDSEFEDDVATELASSDEDDIVLANVLK